MKTSTNNKENQNSKSKNSGGSGATDLSLNNSAKNKAKVLLPPPSSAVSRSKHNSGSSKNDNAKRNVIQNSNNSNNNVNSNTSRFLQFVGPSCGHHASYTFYKAIKYIKNGQTHILGLGEFFFVKIWPNSDLVAIGELQLLWEDTNTNQILSSTRLYFLPEYTPEGRTHHHGEDEVVSVSEKAVLRVSDLLDWISNPSDIDWDRGILGVCHDDCVNTSSQLFSSSKITKKEKSSAATNGGGGSSQESPQSPSKEITTDDKNKSKKNSSELSSVESDVKENGGKLPMLPGGVKPQYDNALNAKFSPVYHEFLADIDKEKEKIGDTKGTDDLAVIIVSHSQYSRYRSVLKRIAGCEKEWMNNSLIVALGGFTTPTRRSYVLFCRDNFDYAELEEHPHLCNHLAPKLKGRPRKKRKPLQTTGVGSPGESEASSESSTSTSVSIQSSKISSRNGIKKDLLQLLSQKSTKEEYDFLRKLISFMEKRNTPIERPPMLGFKQIDLHAFFEKVAKLGGYDGCVHGKAWKSVYDELGGNPQNTSAATCTRRHYERFLLPYERHTRTKEERRKLKPKSKLPRDQEKDGDMNYTSSSNRHSRRSQGASSPVALDLKYIDNDEDEPDDDSPTLSEKDGTLYNKDGSRVEPDMPLDATKSEDEEKPSIDSIKNNPLLPELHNLMDSKQDSHMRIDPDGKRLQIDDLIIIPNNLHTPGAAGTEGTGSALQNLAKIASRYQDTGRHQGGLPGIPLPAVVPGGTSPSLSGLSNLSSTQSTSDHQGMDVDLSTRRRSGSSDNQSLNMAKKPRIDFTNAALSGKSLTEAEAKLLSQNLTSSQLQQSLLSMFPPNLLAGLPPALLSGSASGISSAQNQHKGGIGNNSGSGNKPTAPAPLNASINALSTGASNTTLKGTSTSDVSSLANANNCMQLLAACSMVGMPPIPLPSDLSKLGPEGLNLLQMYEKHLRQIATTMSGGSGGTTSLKNGNSTSITSGAGSSPLSNIPGTKKENTSQNSQSHKYPSGQTGGLNSSGGSQSVLNTVKEKDRSKVCKPPPDTKRPPSLMQTPCAFKQTTSIYTNPLAELTKAREAAAANSASSSNKSSASQQLSMGHSNMALSNMLSSGNHSMAPLDLTSTPKKHSFTGKSPPPLTSPKPGGGMGLNLKKESSLLKPGAIGSSGQENTSSSAKNQQALDLAAILQLDPSKLDPATAALHLQLTQQLAANPQLLNPSNPSYLNLSALGKAPTSTSLATSGSSSIKNETKVSPFSAEALLSKPSPSKLHSTSNSNPYSDMKSSVKNDLNSMPGKSLYSSSLENIASDRRVSNSSPSANSSASYTSSAKLAAAQANAAALAFGLPIGASSTLPPRQSPSSSGLVAASSTSHSPSSSNTEKYNRNAVSPWHSNLASNAHTTITPSPKHMNPSPAPSTKTMPPLTTNPNAAAAALLDKLGLDKLGVDKETLLKDPTFQSALLNLGIPPSLLGTVSSSGSSIPHTTIPSSMSYSQSSLGLTSNHSVTPTMSALSHAPLSSTGSSPYGVTSTSWGYSNPTTSLSQAAQSQSLLSNPYLALMGGGSASAHSQLSASSASALPKSSQSNYASAAALMDPATSAYYAALYSQQMFGAAGLNPYSGLPAGGVPRGAVPSQQIPGLDAIQAASLQAMMGGIRPSTSSYGGSSAAAASAAAMANAMAAAAAQNPVSSANPFGAYAGLSGLSGFPGLGGYPPSRKDS